MPRALPSLRPAGGRYRVTRTLGEGGMGVVHEVWDAARGERLALKRLRPEAAPYARLFEREYCTLASLRHPRAVRVFDYGVDEHGPYYTMELLEGTDLAARAPMPFREVCACLRDAASLLGLLHARQLLHRDLTPRNLWLTPDGRLKLIDFGALAPFGPAAELIGTPAFVAPEALRGEPLDQRTDLFALGALGYWLLTGTHAFRAAHFSELPSLWEKRPAAPSSLAKLVQGGDHSVPPELDALLLALLRVAPDERPRSTGELVSKLSAVAGLAPEAEQLVIHGYLDSGVFVGRASERARFVALLGEVSGGAARALVVRGPEGAGRSRFLSECGTVGRLQGALVVSVEASSGARPYHAALGIAQSVLDALPDPARIAAGEHAPVLADWAPELSAKLGAPPAPAPATDPLADRLRKQLALEGWLRSLARARTLVLLADDIARIDEESLALLVALTRDDGARIMIVASCDERPEQEHTPTARALRAASEPLLLASLTAHETRELLRSTFGEVPYLDRVCARVHAVSGGLPGHLMLLVQRLVAGGHARYAHGAWQLPSELPHDLPSSLRDGLQASIGDLTDDQRELLAVVSLSAHQPLARAPLAALLGWPAAKLDDALHGLLIQGFVAETRGTLALAQLALREPLSQLLAPERRARLHTAIGVLLAPDPAPAAQLCAAIHFLQAGQRRRAQAHLVRVARAMLGGALPYPRGLAQLCEVALALLREAGADLRAQAPVLCVLAMASYQVDRSYARFGEDALAALEGSLCFAVARKLRPHVGGLLALVAALLVAGCRRRARVGVLEAAAWLVTVLGYLMGPASLSLDRAKLQRYLGSFELLSALGKDHAVSVVQLFGLGLLLGVEDRATAAQEAMGRVVARLRSPRPVRGMPAGNRRNLLAAASYACGLREASACDPHLLTIADELAAGSPMHALQADRLRSVYFTYVGDSAQASAYEHKVETRAIQLGTAWQAELLQPRLECRAALWTFDYARHKRGAHALARLAESTPSFARSARWAAGTDLVLDGRYDEAIALLDRNDEPLGEVGWVGVQAILAQAHNESARFDLAKRCCERALAHLRPEDRSFVILYLPAEVELCIADAALGAAAAADQRLAALLAEHAHKGPLVLGYLHGARARVAALARDAVSVERHLGVMESCYRPLGIPSLHAHAAAMRHRLIRAGRPSLTSARPLAADDCHLITRVGLMLTRDFADDAGAAQAVLALAVQLSRAESGFILYPGADVPTASFGSAPSPALLAWAQGCVDEAAALEERTATLEADELPGDAHEARFDGGYQRVNVLWTRDGAAERPVAALVLGASLSGPALPSSAVLRLLADHLARSGAREARAPRALSEA